MRTVEQHLLVVPIGDLHDYLTSYHLPRPLMVAMNLYHHRNYWLSCLVLLLKVQLRNISCPYPTTGIKAFIDFVRAGRKL